jgi:hypothetical protein
MDCPVKPGIDVVRIARKKKAAIAAASFLLSLSRY